MGMTILGSVDNNGHRLLADRLPFRTNGCMQVVTKGIHPLHGFVLKPVVSEKSASKHLDHNLAGD
jgi:hypothetical protein